MATKTFNIGEYAIGGRLQINITGKVIQIKALDWNDKSVVSSGAIESPAPQAFRKIDTFLNELTSSYYADKIIKWIEAHIKLNIY